MSLDWDIGKIRDYKTYCYRDNGDGTTTLNGKTEALIWATMPVGMGSITERNWETFYRRLHLLEKITGTFCHRFVNGKKETRYFTPDEVKRHVGLRTNASSISQARFLKYVWERISTKVSETQEEEQ